MNLNQSDIPQPVLTYLSGQPSEIRDRLIQLIELVRTLVPEATLSVAYGMPGFKFRNKQLVYLAGFRNHIGVYALPATHAAFADRLAGFKQGKGSVQFPHDRPVPAGLIADMIRYHVQLLEGSN